MCFVVSRIPFFITKPHHPLRSRFYHSWISEVAKNCIIIRQNRFRGSKFTCFKETSLLVITLMVETLLMREFRVARTEHAQTGHARIGYLRGLRVLRLLIGMATQEVP